APWFGSNRSLARHVGGLLQGCGWVGVPFAGGMSELLHITARTIVVSDLHKHVMNLARVLAHPQLGPKLLRRLRRRPVHAGDLAYSQGRCLQLANIVFTTDDDLLEWAEHYFVVAWMGRNGTAGTNSEFRSGLSVRWDAGGGDSATRYHSAVKALRDWFAIMPRCTFIVLDVFQFLDNVTDLPECGLYLDPPFPDVGAAYTHKFTVEQHRELARRLTALEHVRVVCRFYRHPLIEELYPAPHWHWLELEGGRTQTNGKPPEVLILNWNPLTQTAKEAA
ncbi:unnamed protein product, partial [Phaeothamnion confervicola]